MVVLITGANGWLGKNVVRFLAERRQMSFISEQTVQLILGVMPSEDTLELSAIAKDTPFKIASFDVTNATDVRSVMEQHRPDYVIHTAGIIHPSKVKNFFEINFVGTQNVLREARNAGAKKAVALSSNSPFGFNLDSKLFDENSEFHPYMGYGKSKMMMEKWIREFTSENSVMSVAVVRAPWFYGPHQPARQTLFFQMIRDGKFPIVGNGENLRSMAFTEKLSEGVVRALFLSPPPYAVYWIADRRPYTMNEIVETVALVLKEDFSFKVSDRKVRLPSFVSDIARGIDFTLQSVGLYHQKFHVLSEMNSSIACSVEKAERELGFQPADGLRAGMRVSVQDCIDRKLL